MRNGIHMNILVCIKQVPDTTEIRIDPVNNTLIRDGVPSIVNTYDLYALEAAARIKDEFGSTHITVLTMGPESAENALRECLAVAADDAYLVSGKEFSGSDTMATSQVLAAAIKHIESIEGNSFDAVFCGKQAIDGDTAQVGPELAENLDLPQITSAESVVIEDGKLIVIRETQNCTLKMKSKLPCLITFTKPMYVPRAATIKRKMAARKAEIKRLSLDDLTVLGQEMIGLKGSPTRVVSTSVPKNNRKSIMLNGADLKETAGKLIQILNETRAIRG